MQTDFPKDSDPNPLCQSQGVKLIPNLLLPIDFVDPIHTLYYNGSIICQGPYFTSVYEFDPSSRQITNSYVIQDKANIGPVFELGNDFMWVDEYYKILLMLSNNHLYFSLFNGTSWVATQSIRSGFIARNSIKDVFSIGGITFVCARSDGLDLYNASTLLEGTNNSIITYLYNINSTILLSYNNATNDVIDIEYDSVNSMVYILDKQNGLYAIDLHNFENSQENNIPSISPTYPVINQTDCYRFIKKDLEMIMLCEGKDNQYPIKEFYYNSSTKQYISNREVFINQNPTDLMADDYFVYIQTVDTLLAYQHSIPTEYLNDIEIHTIMSGIHDSTVFNYKYPYLFLIMKYNSLNIINMLFQEPTLNCYNNGNYLEGDYKYNIKILQRSCNNSPLQNSIYDGCVYQFHFIASIRTPIFGNEKIALAVGLSVGLSIGVIIISLLIWRLVSNKKEYEKLKYKYLKLDKMDKGTDFIEESGSPQIALNIQNDMKKIDQDMDCKMSEKNSDNKFEISISGSGQDNNSLFNTSHAFNKKENKRNRAKRLKL